MVYISLLILYDSPQPQTEVMCPLCNGSNLSLEKSKMIMKSTTRKISSSHLEGSFVVETLDLFNREYGWSSILYWNNKRVIAARFSETRIRVILFFSTPTDQQQIDHYSEVGGKIKRPPNGSGLEVRISHGRFMDDCSYCQMHVSLVTN